MFSPLQGLYSISLSDQGLKKSSAHSPCACYDIPHITGDTGGKWSPWQPGKSLFDFTMQLLAGSQLGHNFVLETPCGYRHHRSAFCNRITRKETRGPSFNSVLNDGFCSEVPKDCRPQPCDWYWVLKDRDGKGSGASILTHWVNHRQDDMLVTIVNWGVILVLEIRGILLIYTQKQPLNFAPQVCWRRSKYFDGEFSCPTIAHGSFKLLF